MKSAQEIVRQIAAQHPGGRFAVNENDSMVGMWVEEKGRFVAVAFKSVFGDWYSDPAGILVNNEPIPANWTEVTPGNHIEEEKR